MQERRPAFDQLRAAVRFDGLWWRKFAYLGCVYGPEWWKRYSPIGIAWIIYVLVGSNRRGAAENMRRVLNEPDPQRAAAAARRMFVDFAHCFTETMEYYGPRPKPFRVDVPERDPLAEALRRGEGAVVVTGHFGNWDVAARTLHTHGRPINIVMAREANASTQEYVRVAREKSGVRIIYSDSSVFSSLNMIHALRQNEVVALQLDRMSGPGGARSLPFFGALASFPSGPFVLARLSGAPLIPVFVPRLDVRHYGVRLGSEIYLKREMRDAQALERAMAQVVGEFEAIIREFPSQWFQFTPFWPAAPVTVNRVAAGASAPPRRRVGG